jgi:hypothetical protein
MNKKKGHKLVTLGDALGEKNAKLLKARLKKAVTTEIDMVTRCFFKAKKRIENNGVKYNLTKHRRDAILNRTRVLLQRGQGR